MSFNEKANLSFLLKTKLNGMKVVFVESLRKLADKLANFLFDSISFRDGNFTLCLTIYCCEN